MAIPAWGSVIRHEFLYLFIYVYMHEEKAMMNALKVNRALPPLRRRWRS